ITVSVPCREGEHFDDEFNTTFSIYPNPNNGTFTISVSPSETNNLEMEIFNTLGEIIYSSKVESSEQTIYLKNTPSGIYFVRIFDGINYTEQMLIIE
ncbi:MAG: T9SS type A sorting domain-containing protein, partial [Chitinophagales bacterium]